MKFMHVSELLAQPRGNQIAILLREAAASLDVGNSESVCWRVADAALLLQRRLLKRGCSGLQGLDTPTGMGAVIGPFSHKSSI